MRVCQEYEANKFKLQVGILKSNRATTVRANNIQFPATLPGSNETLQKWIMEIFSLWESLQWTTKKKEISTQGMPQYMLQAASSTIQPEEFD